MNRITIELSAEDRARLDALIAGLEKLQPNCESCVEAALHIAEDFRNEKPAAAPAEDLARPAGNPAAATIPAVEPPSLADFQKAVALRCAQDPSAKPKVRELVNRFAASVSEIPPEKRIEFLELLAKI